MASLNNVRITREVLALYDDYDGDFGLLDECWARKKDRQRATPEQMQLFSEYVDKLRFIRLNPDLFHPQLMADAFKRIAELETIIDREVIEILRARLLGRTDQLPH